MYCPKCKKENPDDARFCNSCGCLLSQPPGTAERVNVRISKLAIASLVCALCGLALTLPSLIAITSPRVISPRSEWVGLTFLISLFILAVSLVLGIIGIVRIEAGGGKITGRAFAIASVLVAVFAGLLHVWFIISPRPRSTAIRASCETNLSGLGKAMLIYANDYDDELPRAGGKSSVWSNSIPDWLADNRFTAYGLSADGSGGRATITSSFYLLVKYSEVTPKSFLCKREKGTTEFNPADDGHGDRKLIVLWDFGIVPREHCSYSYHIPYGPYPLTTSCGSGLAVAADPNPWMMAPAANPKNIANFDPNGDREAIKAGNCIPHQGDGQNVLFMDGHVRFEKHSFCGTNEDNIYTYWDGPDIRRGAFPVLGSQPADRLDSMLVNDPTIPR